MLEMVVLNMGYELCCPINAMMLLYETSYVNVWQYAYYRADHCIVVVWWDGPYVDELIWVTVTRLKTCPLFPCDCVIL